MKKIVYLDELFGTIEWTWVASNVFLCQSLPNTKKTVKTQLSNVKKNIIYQIVLPKVMKTWFSSNHLRLVPTYNYVEKRHRTNSGLLIFLQKWGIIDHSLYFFDKNVKKKNTNGGLVA